jgi:membrane protease YdiL (CAAX protease family)
MPALIDYLIAIAPAGILALCLLWLIPRTEIAGRTAIYILFFLLARDAMGPHGFWQLTASTLSLTAPSGVLLMLAAICAGLCLMVWRFEPLLCAQVRYWKQGHLLRSVSWGLAGAVFIGCVVLALKAVSGMASVTAAGLRLDWAVLIFALAGNAFEELMFRGVLQGRLAQQLSPMRAIVIPALLFSLCHAWLAIVVTGIGAPILVFTLIEGLVAGFVYWRAGLVAAVLAHGLAIYGLAVGLY